MIIDGITFHEVTDVERSVDGFGETITIRQLSGETRIRLFKYRPEATVPEVEGETCPIEPSVA